VLLDGVHIDKQFYREGGAVDEVLRKLVLATELTGHFRLLPHQRIILWRWSEKDDTSAFSKALGADLEDLLVEKVLSAHKEPTHVARTFQIYAQQYHGSVVIAYVGRSNGLGPILSAASTLPVISVPASVQSFPADVWSSLRMPSAVPAATVLDPGNAIDLALNILSASNPRLYAHKRTKVEDRTVNVVPL